MVLGDGLKILERKCTSENSKPLLMVEIRSHDIINYFEYEKQQKIILRVWYNLFHLYLKAITIHSHFDTVILISKYIF